MILFFILASWKALPEPEEMTDNPFVHTPVSVRHFPKVQRISTGSLAMRGRSQCSEHRLPSLVEICCDHMRTFKLLARAFMIVLLDRCDIGSPTSFRLNWFV